MSKELMDPQTGELKTIDDTSVALVTADSRIQHELQSSILAAKRFPRDELAAFNKVAPVFSRPGMAHSASYSFPRGGKSVEGPSVDTARQLARLWGNLRFGHFIVDMTADMVHIKGYCFDLESNSYVEYEDKFERLVQRKTGWVKPDERDLRELVNRRGAILVRNAILQIIPPDFIDEALRASKAALRGEIGDSLEDKLRSMLKMFESFGVSKSMIEELIEHDASLINKDELIQLGQIYKSMKDGNTKREDHFELKKPKGGDSSGLKGKLEEEPNI